MDAAILFAPVTRAAPARCRFDGGRVTGRHRFVWTLPPQHPEHPRLTPGTGPGNIRGLWEPPGARSAHRSLDGSVKVAATVSVVTLSEVRKSYGNQDVLQGASFFV